MSMTGLEAFDTTIQKTNLWLHEIMDEMHSEDKRRAYVALRAVLHTLRDHLRVEDAVQLSAQLPLLIRGIYYDGWQPKGTPVKEKHLQAFLDHISMYFKNEVDLDPQAVAAAVFRVLDRHISQGEIQDIRHLLPRHIRELWPQEAIAR